VSFKSETTHQVGAHTVTVRELSGPVREYFVCVSGDKYEVFLGNETDPGTNPTKWYTEVGGALEGPYDTAEQLIDEMFLTEEI
jgi:hypothetical protein